MNCRNLLCCYYSEESCLLKEIEIDDLGMCSSQILVQLEEGLLAEKRRKMRAHLRQIEMEWTRGKQG